MTSSIFLTKNLAILFIAIQSIDPYINDKLLKESSMIKIETIFKIEDTEILNYTNSRRKYKLAYLIILTHLILVISSQTYIQRAINSILEDFNSEEQNSKKAHKYIERFAFNYYRIFQPYLIGYSRYNNYNWIKRISMTNLFLLHKACQYNGNYHAVLYLLQNSSNLE
jgi:hypothetical protein